MKTEIEVAVPFCHSDVDLTCRLLAWIHELGGARGFDAVLIPSFVCPPDGVRRVITEADRVFHTIRVSPCQFTDAPWPVGPNMMFAWAAMVITGPFLWIEPDCVPTRATWLHEIREAYSICRKPIMAHWYDDKHTSGVAVYHPAAAKELCNAGDKRHAWDSRSPELFRKLSENTTLIQHFWGQKGHPPKFVHKTNGEPYTATLRMVNPETALFHRCKDGSLMDRLRERMTSGSGGQTNGKLPMKAFVQLGRFGDIINLLPVLRAEASAGRKPAVVVSKRFASVFDGVSYVSPVPVDLGEFDLRQGIEYAKSKFEEVVVSQVYGKDMENPKTSDHFNVQSWEQCGYGLRWIDPTLRLVFDRRDYARERRIIEQHVLTTKKPVILLNLKGGFSSRFPDASAMERLIRMAYPDRFEFVDLAGIRCERIYDLCGLLEVAAGMVTIDTATLHLAGVSEIPVLALLSPNGKWLESNPRCRTHASFPCNQWRNRWDEVLLFLDDCATRRAEIVHVFERHGSLNQREIKAQATWGCTGWKPTPYECYERDARGIGDQRDLPYLRDALRHGLRNCGIHDYVAFTNSDIEFSDRLDAEVRRAMRGLVMLTARRTDYFQTGDPHEEFGAGRDLLVFRADWLARNIDTFPDFLIGASHWDWWACLLARRLVGLGGDEASCHQQHTPQCELDHTLMRHCRHSPQWLSNTSSPSEVHNRRLFKEFIEQLPSVIQHSENLRREILSTHQG